MLMKRNFFYSKNGNAKTVRKNCFWTEVNGIKYLISYTTVVAAINELGYFHRLWDDYSVTTLNQVNQFINLFDNVKSTESGETLRGFNKKEWLEYPIKHKISMRDYLLIKPLLPNIEYNQYSFVEKISYAK